MPLLERNIYIDGDGKSYPLDTASSARVVLTDEGTGMPPIEYITERGPFQHGESVNAYFLRPRTVQFVIRQNACSRDDYWKLRAGLIDALRPNKGMGVLRKVLSDGRKFDLDVRILEGPRFEPRDISVWDEWAIQETIRFVAHDPIYYDPTQYFIEFSDLLCPGFTYDFPFTFCEVPSLVLPFTLPFSFSAWEVSANIEYNGTWIEYPTFVLTGRMTGIVIENVTTDEKIDLRGFSLAEGETAIIDLTYGAKTAFKSNGENLLPYLTGDSDLTSFHLAVGDNLLKARAVYSGLSTNVGMYWKERFIGI